jgi:hypothetical protein
VFDVESALRARLIAAERKQTKANEREGLRGDREERLVVRF